MVSSMPTKLRQAIGAFKDRASISIARVSCSRLPNLDVAIVKATSHDAFPPHEKYVQEILYLASCSREHLEACVSCIRRRLSRTSDWIVALKVLLLCHRLLQFGDPGIEHELLVSRRRGMRLSNVSDFYDGSHPHGWDFSAFVRAYGVYLDERLDCPTPSLSSLRYNDRNSHSNGDCLSPDQNRTSLESQKARHRRKPVKKMKPYELMEKFPAFLRLIKRIVCCRPSGVAKFHELVLSAMHYILTESFLLYKDVHDGMAILLDGFFDMEQCDCDTAFAIYCSAAKQVDELICFYNFCKTLPIVGDLEYPSVENVSQELLQTMEASLKLRLASSQVNNKRNKNTHTRSVSFQDEVEEMAIHENGCVSVPPVPTVTGESVSRRPSALKTSGSSKEALKLLIHENGCVSVPPVPTVTGESVSRRPALKTSGSSSNGDAAMLADTNKTVTSLPEEHKDELTLSLFSGPKAETKITVTWETFSPVEKRPVIFCQGQPYRMNSVTSGWEHALLETETSTSRPVTGSFVDHLLLDCSPYDQAEEQKIVADAAVFTGIPIDGTNPSQFHTNVLALPAPPAAARSETTDPFVAFINAPPQYVQMAELNEKTRHLVAEQKPWPQCQPANLHGYNANLMNCSRNPFVAQFLPQTMQPIHCYGTDSYFHGSFSSYSA